MQRAAVFIGVRRTGNLPELQDAVGSARRMHAWALTQGLVDKRSALLVTDAKEPVTQPGLLASVQQLIEKIQPEQLVIYFSGHGVALNGEQWLLSDAPVNPSAAIDLRMSADVAETGEVPHVVFLSDACRTAPAGIEAQRIVGGSIVPNSLTGEQRFVDVFYACGLGKPSLEIQDGEVSAKNYRAVFTEVLLEALKGNYPGVYLPFAEGESEKGFYADPRQLRNTLHDEVPRRIRSKRLKALYNQIPTASVSSDPGTWLARLDKLPRPRRRRAPAKRPGTGEGMIPDLAVDPAPPPQDEVPTPRRRRQASMLAAERTVRTRVRDTAQELADPHGPDHFESGCGIKVRGASVVEVVGPPDVPLELLDPQVVRVSLWPRRSGTAVVRLDSGDVAVVPLVHEFLTGLTLDEGELISVEIEPSTYSQRYGEFDAQKDQIRHLRAQVAAASAFGRFDPQGSEFDELARSLQQLKGLDPALAVYAGHSYYARGEVARIAEMSEYLYADLQIRLFDLELLARKLIGRQPRKEEQVLPSFPLLGQGWSLARSHSTRMPAGLTELPSLVRDSLWTLYAPEAFPLLQQALEKGRIR